jgi:hypothetical protein
MAATAGPQVIRRMIWRGLDFYGLCQGETPQLRGLALDDRTLSDRFPLEPGIMMVPVHPHPWRAIPLARADTIFATPWRRQARGNELGRDLGKRRHDVLMTVEVENECSKKSHQISCSRCGSLDDVAGPLPPARPALGRCLAPLLWRRCQGDPVSPRRSQRRIQGVAGRGVLGAGPLPIHV